MTNSQLRLWAVIGLLGAMAFTVLGIHYPDCFGLAVGFGLVCLMSAIRHGSYE